MLLLLCGPGGAPCPPQVQQLKSQLGEACHFNTQLTGLIENKDEKLNILKDHFSQIKTKYQVGSELTVTAAWQQGRLGMLVSPHFTWQPCSSQSSTCTF